MAAVAILEYIISLAADEFLQYIKDLIAGPAADRISEVIKNQKEILNAVENLQFQIEASNAVTRITYWTARMSEIIEYMKSKSGKIDTDDGEYQRLLSALRDDGQGVRLRASILYDAVIGAHSDTAGGKALEVWHHQFYSKLSDKSNFDYFLSDYIKDMDKRIAAVAFVLRQGLLLSLFIARDEAQAEKLRGDCETRIRNILNTVYTTYYPPALRFFKESYDKLGDIDQPTLPWFWLRKKGADGTYLCMKGFGPSDSGRALSVDTKPMLMPEAAPAWKFSLHRDEEVLGSLQLLCNWADDGKQVINLRTNQRVSQGGITTSLSFTTSTEKGHVGGTHFSTQPILFKLIPLPGLTEPAVDLVPFYPVLEPKARTEVVDTYNTFRSTFILAKPVAGVGIGLPAPVEWGST